MTVQRLNHAQAVVVERLEATLHGVACHLAQFFVVLRPTFYKEFESLVGLFAHGLYQFRHIEATARFEDIFYIQFNTVFDAFLLLTFGIASRKRAAADHR